MNEKFSLRHLLRNGYYFYSQCIYIHTYKVKRNTGDRLKKKKKKDNETKKREGFDSSTRSNVKKKKKKEVKKDSLYL